jgi:hypothetical protein
LISHFGAGIRYGAYRKLQAAFGFPENSTQSSWLYLANGTNHNFICVQKYDVNRVSHTEHVNLIARLNIQPAPDRQAFREKQTFQAREKVVRDSDFGSQQTIS